MACFRTRCWVLLNRTLLSTSPPESLQDPVRVPPSAPIGEETLDIGHMIRKTRSDALNLLNKSSNHGGSSPGIEVEDEHGVEQTLVSLNPVALNHINDNHSSTTQQDLSAQGLKVVKQSGSLEQILNCQSYKQCVMRRCCNSFLSEQELQPWRQFSRNRGRGRARGRANSRFSKSRGFKPYK